MLPSEEWLVEGVLRGGDTGLRARLLRGLLTPLAGLHRAGLAAYLLPYQTGIRKRYRLHSSQTGRFVPTIAIGNLSSGGTGKTPMAALVVQELRGILGGSKTIALLSRGHRGAGDTSASGPRVVSDADGTILLSAEEAGDEPALLARLLPGVPVIVGRDRRQSGRLAVSLFAPDAVVLDDALQFWQLHRDLDIVLLDARRPFDNGQVLPRGLLREPPSHLKRAGLVVLTRADRVTPEELEAAQKTARHHAHPDTPILTAVHAPTGWVPRVEGGELLPADTLAGRRVLAFCGIADGQAFRQTIEELGATVAGFTAWDDHHAYTTNDIARLSAEANAAKVGAVVTTEKDLMKVAPLWPDDAPPLYALRIALTVNDPDALRERLHAALAPRP